MVWTTLERYRDEGLLILRLGFGLGFVWFHGLPKLLGGAERREGVGGAVSSLGIDFGHEWWGLAATLAEVVGGLLIAAGLFFRPAVLAVLAVMVVATANHWITGRGSAGHSFKNAFVLMGLFLIGPGRYSLDHALSRRRGGTPGTPPGAPAEAPPAAPERGV